MMKSLFWIALLTMILSGLGIAEGQGTEPFSDYSPITPDNASQLVSIGDLGYGYPLIPYWSPNGQSIVFPATNGFLLWSVNDEHPVFIRKSLQSLTWLNDHEIAIADPNGVIYSWNARTGEWQRLFSTGLPYVYGLDYHAQADALIMRGHDDLISLYLRASGELIGEIACSFSRGFPTKDYVISPDGEWFACANGEQAAMMRLSSGELVVLSEEAARSVPQFSADSTLLAYATADEKVHLIRTEDQTERIVFERAYPGAFSPDSHLYVIGFYQTDEIPSRSVVWDIEANTEVASFLGGRDFAFSGDGALIAYDHSLPNPATCRYNELRVFDLQAQTDTRIVEGRYATTYAGGYPIEFFGEDLWVISEDDSPACNGGRVALWNPATGLRQISIFPYRQDYTLSPNGRYIATFVVPAFSAASVTWRVIAAEDSRDMFPPVEFASTDDWHSLTFSPDGEWIATGGGNENIQQWFMDDLGETSREFGITGYPSQAPLNDLAYSPDGRLMASAAEDYTSGTLWSAETGEKLFSIRGGFYAVTFSPAGQMLVFGQSNGHVAAYLIRDMLSAPDPEENTLLPWRDFVPEPSETEAASTRTNVTDVALNAQGTYVVASSMDGTVRLWDVMSGIELQRHRLNGAAWGVVFSPDGASYAVSAQQSEILIAQVDTGEAINLPLDSGDENMGFFDVTYNPDGTVIASLGYKEDASGAWQNILYLWDARTHERLNRIETGDDGLPFHLEFSPDGKFLAAAVGRGGMIHLWGIEN